MILWTLLWVSIAALSAFADHTNNWAILVSTSRYWFNYRHMANTLSLYRTVKSLGIPDEQIILMLPEDMACNPRNSHPAQIFNDKSHRLNVYGEEIEVDYRGTDVTVENFLRLLAGRHDPTIPRSKRLLTDENSNILVYFSGHGGDQFLKFQDTEEITAEDMAAAVEQMHRQKRYNEMLLLVDTCQASTLNDALFSPGVIAIGSSKLGENSFSHHADPAVGVSVIDRFTFHTLEFFEKYQTSKSVGEYFRYLDHGKLRSTAEFRDDLIGRPLDEIPASDFFASVSSVYLTPPSGSEHGFVNASFISSSSSSSLSSSAAASLPAASVAPALLPVPTPPQARRRPTPFEFSSEFVQMGSALLLCLVVGCIIDVSFSSRK